MSTREMEAFYSLESMIESVPDIDYDKELADYRDERYGEGVNTDNSSAMAEQ